MRITGTFIDEITHDIPSQNWGEREWAREFDLYQQIGLDTLIIIRAGYRNRCIFDSRSIPDLLPSYTDLGETLFRLFTEAREIRRGIIKAGQDTAAPDFGRGDKGRR